MKNIDAKKKIAILAPYIGVVNRGAESFVIELVKKLRVKYAIDIYSVGENIDIKDSIIRIDVNENFLFKLHEKLFNKYELYRIIMWKFYYLIPDIIYQRNFSKKVYKQIMKEGSYDLIFPNNGVWGVHYAKKIKRKKGTPILYTGHGGIGKGEKLILAKKPDIYVCLTKKHLDWARKYSHNICLIGNGVDVDKFKYKESKKNQLPLILSVGALTAFKRHELTIQAMKYIKNARLLILGEGELKEKLDKMIIDNQLSDRCFIRNVEYSEIEKYYHNADLFVLPSSEAEAYGIVYLEAMASNLPIVATNDETRQEIIGKSGILCNVENIEEYAKSIEEALKREWRDIPYQNASRHDWNIVAQRYDEVIESLIN